MKTIHTLLSVLAFSVAGSALAGGDVYPEPAIPSSESVKTRAEVIAETHEAQRLGLLTVGEEDVRVAMPESVKTRAEVIAETREAQRLGLLTVGEEDVRVATAQQEQLIAAAGRRAAEQMQVASEGKSGAQK
jgi:hypothetical protein